MTYAEDDMPDGVEGPVVVRRAIYEAALAFERKLGPDASGAISEAQDRMDRYKAAGNARASRRWGKIYAFLLDRAGAATGSKTIILKPGEKYDSENERVIRPYARRPRSGRAT
jgi:hypothetical protein